MIKLFKTYMHKEQVIKTYIKSTKMFNMGDKYTPAHNSWQYGCRATTSWCEKM